VVPVDLREARGKVGNHAQEWVSGIETHLGLEPGEPLRRLCRQHERMDEILGRMVDPDE